MTLEPRDAAQFFRTFMPLLGFANRELKVVEPWAEPPPGKLPRISPEQGVPVRNALWQNAGLLDRFVSENPANLDEEDLALAASWKHRVAGNFTILRPLKKHTIVIQESRAYGVLGLLNEIDEIVPFLPIVAEFTLLPFKDRIVVDGLFNYRQIYLGSGIRGDLNAVYKQAQEGSGLITSLIVPEGQKRQKIAEGNAKLLKAFRASLAGASLTEKTLAQHVANVAGYADDLLADDPPRPLVDADLDSARVYLVSHPEAATCLKRFARFLFDTGRGTANHVFDLRELRRR